MRKNYKQNIQLRFNISQLDSIILSMINFPGKKRFIGNIETLFNSFLSDSYTNDYERQYRVFMIRKIASTILENNIERKNDLLNFINFEGKYSNECIELLNQLFNEEISEREIELVDKNVSQQLRYGIIGDEAESLSEEILNYQTDNYEDLDMFMDNFLEKISNLERNLRRSKSSFHESKNDANLADSSFVDCLSEIITEKRNPSTKIKTGIQLLNEILNGGFERGRLYLALGLPKGWKSGFLLNSCLWALKYNNLKAQDPTKKPVIVYLTMENTMKETIERIWSYCFGNHSKIEDFEPAEAARMLEQAGIFTPNDPEKPELLIWHRSNKSINTADLDSLLDDLAKEGKECVFLVQDYIKRIRPVNMNKEIRLELSNVSDELATIAKNRNIPILTAMQLNREAIRVYEDSSDITSQLSSINKMGASNVGESIDLIQNVDYAFILGRVINTTRDESGEIETIDKYLAFKLIACRVQQPKHTSFEHRFKDDNDMALQEDFNLKFSISVNNIEGVVRQKIENGSMSIKGKRQVI